MSELIGSALSDLHAAHSIELTEYHGARVPARFSDAQEEHRAVRTAAGFFDFSFRLMTLARGPDSRSFLHNMLSNDIQSLKSGEGVYATFLDVKGHMIADLRIYCAEDLFLIETDADLRQKFTEMLGRYIIMDDVTLDPSDHTAIAFEGPRSRQLLESAIRATWPALDEYQHVRVNHERGLVRIARSSNTGEEGYQVWGATHAIRALWQEASRQADRFAALPCGTQALESLRIEAGIPRYGPDMGDDTIPLEAGLLNAISFTKGCYIGQEVVERIRSRGHVNWQLSGLFIDSPVAPAAGERLVSITDQREVGEITSSCVSPTLARTIGLAYVRREFSEPGSRLALESGPMAEVVPLPFYKGIRSK